jgi:hypothetical protein
MVRFTLVGSRFALGAAVAAAMLGVSRPGVAQEQFDKALGVDPATREAAEVIPEAEAAAGLKPAGVGAPAAGGGATQAGPTTPGAANEPYMAPPASGSDPATEAARLAVWNSPAMMEARDYITEHGRRSRQFTSSDATAYLERLSQFTPIEMKAWLERYQARRAANQRSAAVSRAARATSVENSVARLQTFQQTQRTARETQSLGAQNAQAQLNATQQLAQTARTYRQVDRDLFLGAMQAGNAFDYFVNPPLYVQMAASASLPGDLPAGDPRNFIRGDVGGGGGAVEFNAGGGR